MENVVESNGLAENGGGGRREGESVCVDEVRGEELQSGQNNQSRDLGLLVVVESDRRSSSQLALLGRSERGWLGCQLPSKHNNSVAGGCRGKPEEDDGWAPKVPNSYLSICRLPIRDSHGPLFLAVTRPSPGFLSRGRESNVGFPGLEGTIRRDAGVPRCVF